jgi:hypothetical protein
MGLAAVLSSATAQTTVTHIFENINRVIPDGQATGMSDTETLTSPSATAERPLRF